MEIITNGVFEGDLGRRTSKLFNFLAAEMDSNNNKKWDVHFQCCNRFLREKLSSKPALDCFLFSRVSLS